MGRTREDCNAVPCRLPLLLRRYFWKKGINFEDLEESHPYVRDSDAVCCFLLVSEINLPSGELRHCDLVKVFHEATFLFRCLSGSNIRIFPNMKHGNSCISIIPTSKLVLGCMMGEIITAGEPTSSSKEDFENSLDPRTPLLGSINQHIYFSCWRRHYFPVGLVSDDLCWQAA